jgi:hypothetical protein
MNSFDLANEALREDLTDYSHALRAIVTAIPQAIALCDRVVKETKLAQALLAFTDVPETRELSRMAVRLSNLWPFRGEPYARTLGYTEEIGEAYNYAQEAQRALEMLKPYSSDVLMKEVAGCFSNIIEYLNGEQVLLEGCHGSIQPHVANMEITRKRLQLLAATVDARMGESDEQKEMLRLYTEAAKLLREWESGVPLSPQGVEILDRCLDILERTGQRFKARRALEEGSDTVQENDLGVNGNTSGASGQGIPLPSHGDYTPHAIEAEIVGES